MSRPIRYFVNVSLHKLQKIKQILKENCIRLCYIISSDFCVTCLGRLFHQWKCLKMHKPPSAKHSLSRAKARLHDFLSPLSPFFHFSMLCTNLGKRSNTLLHPPSPELLSVVLWGSGLILVLHDMYEINQFYCFRPTVWADASSPSHYLKTEVAQYFREKGKGILGKKKKWV